MLPSGTASDIGNRWGDKIKEFKVLGYYEFAKCTCAKSDKFRVGEF